MSTTTTFKAINIALLPDLQGGRAARYINSRLRERVCPWTKTGHTTDNHNHTTYTPCRCFEFDSTHHPHITLFQLFIQSDQMEELFQKISHLFAESPSDDPNNRFKELPPEIRIKSVEKGQNFADQGEAFLPGFVLDDPTHYLSDIHKSVAKIAKQYIVPSSQMNEREKKKYFYTLGVDPHDREITGKSVDYVSQFSEKSAFENYSAHMAVGTGTEKEVSELVERVDGILPQMPTVTFKPESLVIAELGNYCTCRNILYELPLGKHFI